MKISNLKDRTDLGTIIAFAGHDLPEGYLECDGTSFNITDQLPLYLTIGLTYGGNLTGLPANLDWMTTDEVTVILKSSTSIKLRLHRERGLLGLPTIATSTGISAQLGGDSGSSTDYDREDMNTGIITVNNIIGSGWSASSWYASMPSSGTYSASNFVTFANSGAFISNTGFAGTFNVPNLNSGQIIAGGSSNTVSSNIGTRNESIGSNTHTVGGLTVGASGSATINGNGAISNSVAANNVNTSPSASANLQQITHSINMMREHQHPFLLPGTQHLVRGRNTTSGSNRNENKVSVRRSSSNNQTDELHDTVSAGSNNNNKHNHSITINKTGNLDCGVNTAAWSGNTTGNLVPSSTPVNLSVKTRQIVVKYLIKSI
jgi:hypothetical protein